MSEPDQIFARLLGCALAAWFSLQAVNGSELAGRLQQTRALNIDAVVLAQFAEPDPARGFMLTNPYSQRASSTVEQWFGGTGRNAEVCALRFTDRSRHDYELRGFKSATAALAAGFTVTHQGRCGSCSTLHDLAVYLDKPDLTTPARRCARRFGLIRKQRCFEEKIGFTPYCAESWAYNAAHTKDACLGACVSDYGFFNLLFGRYPGDNTDAQGRLRPCLQCDEDLSGPGFKYSAGRTRRNSGIESAIQRTDSELFPVDHSIYFKPPAQPRQVSNSSTNRSRLCRGVIRR